MNLGCLTTDSMLLATLNMELANPLALLQELLLNPQGHDDCALMHLPSEAVHQFTSIPNICAQSTVGSLKQMLDKCTSECSNWTLCFNKTQEKVF